MQMSNICIQPKHVSRHPAGVTVLVPTAATAANFPIGLLELASLIKYTHQFTIRFGAKTTTISPVRLLTYGTQPSLLKSCCTPLRNQIVDNRRFVGFDVKLAEAVTAHENCFCHFSVGLAKTCILSGSFRSCV